MHQDVHQDVHQDGWTMGFKGKSGSGKKEDACALFDMRLVRVVRDDLFDTNSLL